MKELFSLVVLIAATEHVTLLASAAGSGCARGFMELDVIRRRALKIPQGKEASTRLGDEFRLVPDWNFTCDGSITTVMLGADMRPRWRREFPEVQVWRRSETNSTHFLRVHSRKALLDEENFPPSGVFQYQFTPPIPFQSGDVLGIYNPSIQKNYAPYLAHMQLYYKDDKTAPVSYQMNKTNPTSVSIENLRAVEHQYILISVVTDPPCSQGLLSYDALKDKILDLNIPRVRKHTKKDTFFPNLNFTCSGNVTSWIIAGEIRATLGTELQIWRRLHANDSVYVKVASSVVNTTDVNQDHLFRYIPDPPMEFQDGDIFGMYQKGRLLNRGKTVIKDDGLLVYYQTRTGPLSFEYLDYKWEPPSNIEQRRLIRNFDRRIYDYPLITPAFGDPTPSVSHSCIYPSITTRAKTQSSVFPSLLASIQVVEDDSTVIVMLEVFNGVLVFMTVGVITVSVFSMLLMFRMTRKLQSFKGYKRFSSHFEPEEIELNPL